MLQAAGSQGTSIQWAKGHHCDGDTNFLTSGVRSENTMEMTRYIPIAD